MLTVEIAGKVYSCPVSWEDATLAQFFRIRNEWDSADFLTRVEIMTGAPKDLLFTCKQHDLDEKLVPYFEFVYKHPKIRKQLTMMFGTTQYRVKEDLGEYSLGQKLALKDKMAECIKSKGDSVDLIPFAVACYFYPIVTGKKYSTEEAEKFAKEEVMKCSAAAAWAVGNFFLKKSIVSLAVMQPDLITRPIKSKWLRRLAAWISSGYSKLSMRWQGATS